MNFFQRLFSSPAVILKMSIGLCYLALGVFLLVKNDLLYFMDKSYRPIMAVIFIAYGVFRLYRAVNDLKDGNVI